MSDTNSHELFDDELLSAHIDGELTEAERAAVEQRLRDDPQARELVAELRGVSETLRSLPKHELGADLRETVLRQAAVHAERAPAEGGWNRRWTWATLALAAALLLTVYLPEANHVEQPLAQAPSKAAAPLITQSPLREREVEQSVLQFQVGASRAAETDSIALGAVMDGTLRIAPVQAPQIQPIGELPAEDYHVHLTPVDRRVGASQFDQLLVSHGIVVRDENATADESASSEAKLVLVEASLEQIQQIVASCSGNDSPWKSLRLVGQDGADSNLLLFASQKSKVSSVRAARGWARHLGRGPIAPEQSKSTETKFLRKRNIATLESRAVDQRVDLEQRPMATIRVLFILHPADAPAGE